MSEQIVKRSTTIHLDGAPDDVFPLFTPLGEYKWIRGWNPELIYPPSGEAMTNNVFATQHDHQARAIWLTVDYNTQTYHAEYISVTPESHVRRVEVQCRQADHGGTDAQVTITVTAIADAGYAEVEKHGEAFTQHMQTWQLAINHYLEKGELLPQH